MESLNVLPRPRLSEILEAISAPLYRVCDRLYHSRYNPLHRSGTLAVASLFVLLITGVYLILFYSVSTPFASVQRIQEQLWLGRWIRAVHRYATDIAIVATALHVLQVLVQGKVWGPRLLAWISGVVLLFAVFLSAWTGYVMIWDEHAQLLALAGARMLQVLPFLHDALAAAFNGNSTIDQSFFFMNLFLHVGIPLLMVFGIWVHTARLARSDWFPHKKTFVVFTLALIAIAIIWPAPLPSEANLLKVIGRFPIDWFSGFWLPLLDLCGAEATLAIITSFTIILLFVPWWWRLKTVPQKSYVDPELCTGCTQCAQDCPYETISMRPHPAGKRLFAEVNPEGCVSCAICAASCDDLAIGPPGRTGMNQMESVKTFVNAHNSAASVVVAACGHNHGMSAVLQELEKENEIAVYSVECCGTVHSNVLEELLKVFKGVFVLGCPEGHCFNRDGFDLLRQRVYHKRVPFLARHIDKNRVALSAFSSAEAKLIKDKIDYFSRRLLNSSNTAETQESIIAYSTKRAVASASLLIAIAAFSGLPYGTDPQHSLLRIGVQVPGRSKEECRALTAEEKAKLPRHMQRPVVCETRFVDYKLILGIDGNEPMEKLFNHRGFRGDAPLFINHDLLVRPGRHEVEVILMPVNGGGLTETRFKQALEFKVGYINLLTYDSATNSIVASQSNYDI